MNRPLRYSLLLFGFCSLLLPGLAQRSGQGNRLLRTPETPFIPMEPGRKSYIGWEKFGPFSLAPGEKLWWESFAKGNDLQLMLDRGVTHQSVSKTPQAYARALPAKKRAVMQYVNSLEGTYFVDNWYNHRNGLADPFSDNSDELIGRMSGFYGGQREYLGVNEGKTPIDLVYLDFENRALYGGNLYARNVMNNGNFAIRGAKGHYSDGQYLSEYRSGHPSDTRGNDALLSLPVRNTVDNGIYCQGGPEGNLSEDQFLGRYANAYGERVCQMVRQIKRYNLMEGATVGYIELAPGDPDHNLLNPNLAEATTANRWPWGYNCGEALEVGNWLDYASAGYYAHVNTYRNGRFYYYHEPDFEEAIQANIAEDRQYLYSYLNSFENSEKSRGTTGFINLWYPFHDSAPGPASTHFDYPLRNDMAEAMAVFGIYYGSAFIVWTPHGYTVDGEHPGVYSACFKACEYFLAGLKRMSWHNDMRTGDFKRLIPEISVDGGQTWSRDNTYQARNGNRPTVRAIVKGNEILVVGYNNSTNDAQDLSVKVRYNNWQDTFVLKGKNDPNRRVYVGRATMN